MASRDVIGVLKANGWYEVNSRWQPQAIQPRENCGPRHGSSSKKGHPARDTEEYRKAVRAEIQVEGKKVMDYIAYLHKEKDSDYGVSFPDFPGCITAGRTLEEARRMAVEALALHIQGMIEDGATVPEPSKLDDLQSDPDLRDGVALIVPAELPGKRVRVNITAMESQIAEIDRLAEKAGMTRSGYMIQRALDRSLNELPDRPRAKKRHKEVA
jgi:predicted RNase H-like HicB family nuclease